MKRKLFWKFKNIFIEFFEIEVLVNNWNLIWDVMELLRVINLLFFDIGEIVIICWLNFYVLIILWKRY